MQTNRSIYKRRQGFTLIELSIVLVIIGLIVGGVLVGRDLIRSATLNSIITEKGKYTAAVLTFREKYGQLPGDANNATSFWGKASGNASDNYTASCYGNLNNLGQGDTVTCNGDADTQVGCPIDQIWEIYCGQEGWLIWQHLSNAKLIEGAYVPSGSANNAQGVQQATETPGLNIPASRSFPNTGWSSWYLCAPVSEAAVYTTNSCGNKFFYGAAKPTAAFNWLDFAFYPALSGADAKAIDLKIDDGKPATGIVSTLTNNSGSNPFDPSCTTSASPATAQYTSVGGANCALIFNAGF